LPLQVENIEFFLKYGLKKEFIKKKERKKNLFSPIFPFKRIIFRPFLFSEEKKAYLCILYGLKNDIFRNSLGSPFF
jgi:hypothetical protein